MKRHIWLTLFFFMVATFAQGSSPGQSAGKGKGRARGKAPGHYALTVSGHCSGTGSAKVTADKSRRGGFANSVRSGTGSQLRKLRPKPELPTMSGG